MTQAEFNEKCARIMASTELTREEKEKQVRHEATMFTDFNPEQTPEMSDFWKRNTEAEGRLAGHGGFSYCPESGNWYPSRPPEIKALDEEYGTIRLRETEAVFQRVWAGATA